MENQNNCSGATQAINMISIKQCCHNTHSRQTGFQSIDPFRLNGVNTLFQWPQHGVKPLAFHCARVYVNFEANNIRIN